MVESEGIWLRVNRELNYSAPTCIAPKEDVKIQRY
jgi:hypothetical protein